MGVTQVTATVVNLAEPRWRWSGLFFVDTGETDCMAPSDELHKIGLRPTGRREVALADGSRVEYETAVCQVEFMGETVGATIIFGPDHAEPILGVTALESVGIEVDPSTQRLRRLPVVRLK